MSTRRTDAPAGGGPHGITVGWLSGFLCLLVLASVALVWLDATRRVDNLIHDGWVRLHSGAPPEDVVIAAIDPESLEALGRWPWPRETQARLIEGIAAAGARGAVIDILYVEPGATDAADTRLARAVAALPVSIMPVLIERGAGEAVAERLPLPALSRTVTDLGHIVLPIDDDGIVRRAHLKAGFGRAHWPTLSLAALAAFEPDAEALERPLPGRRVEPTTAPYRWARDREVMVPFVGPSGTFARVPAADIVRGELAPGSLAGRIVFVGMTSTGLGDVVPTPVSALERPMPGVELHANLFEALRRGTLVTAAGPWSAPLIALLVLPLMLALYSRAAPRWALPGALVGAALPILASFLLYRYAQLWVAPLPASVPLLASYLLWSRHRLEFVNRFLEREQSKLEPHLSRRDSSDDAALGDFFASAIRHLPIAGWRFDTRGTRREGGLRMPFGRGEFPAGRWVERDGIWSKRYRTGEQMRIDLAIDEPRAAHDITAYVDSLARVRAREPSRYPGTVERLEGNAERLREQMAWLRHVRVFGEELLAGGPVGFLVWNAAGEWMRGNTLVRGMLPGLDERTSLIDFVRAIGHDPGDRGLPMVDERTSGDRQRFDALLLEGVPWQVAHESGDRALIVNFSAIGDRLSRRVICASVDDISEIRTAERARAEMVDYLSHDLQSPLVSALALLDEEGEGMPPAAGRPRTSAVGHIRRSLEMMDDLLHVARADSLSEQSFAPLLLDAVLDNALAGLLPQARSRGIRIEADGVDEELWMSGDAALLERAVGNVIGNAVKYSDDGSRVRVRLRREGRRGVLEVDDEGVGIDPAVIGDLFTRFRRDARVAGRIKGTGLGLALVARVVAQHEGTVDAESAPGQGTRVTLCLPLESAHEAADEGGGGAGDGAARSGSKALEIEAAE